MDLSAGLPPDAVEKLDRIATIIGRDRGWVVLRALRQYLAGEGAEILDDAESCLALDRGEGVPLDDVLEEAEAILSKAIERRHSDL